MSFAQRMLAIALFPLSFLLLYVFMTGSNALDERGKAADTVAATEYAAEFSLLIHELQKERGMSAGFVGSKGAAFGDALREQRALVDQTIPNVASSLQALDRTAPEYVERFTGMIDMLPAMREQINAQDITVPELAGYYTGTIRALFDLTKYSTSNLKNAELGRRANALVAVMEAKERAGLERAMGATGFGSGSFGQSVYNRFSTLGAAQQTFIGAAREYAASEDKQAFETLVSLESYVDIERLRAIVHANRYGGTLEGVTGPEWFAVSTAWINDLKALETQLQGSLGQEAKETLQSVGSGLIMLAAFTAFALLCGIAAPLLIAMKTRREFGALLGVMQRIADDEVGLDVPFKSGRNEISQIARMADTFQTNTIVRKQAESDAEIAREKAKEAEELRRHIAEQQRRAEEQDRIERAEREQLRAQEALEAANLEKARAQSMASAVDELAVALNSLAQGDLSTQIDASFDERLEQLRLDFNRAVRQLAQALEDERAAEEKSRAEKLALDRKLEAEKQAQSKLEQARVEEEREKAARMATAVDALANALKSLAGGDLTVSIDSPFDGNFEALRVDFNDAVARLNQLINSIAEIAQSIDLQTETLSADARDLSRNAEEQEASVSEITSSMRDISQSIQEITGETVTAETAATKVKASADVAADVSRRTLESMDLIEESSREINSIVALVGDIAFQTNLLALNASVEAARAGKHGAGFAVIADEVRALAHKSEESAKDISDLLMKSNEIIKDGVAITKESGQTLEKIEQGFDQVNALIKSIRQSTQSQSEVTVEIEKGVSKVGERTNGNARMAERTNDAATKLKEQTSLLGDLIGQFNHDDDHKPVVQIETYTGSGKFAATGT